MIRAATKKALRHQIAELEEEVRCLTEERNIAWQKLEAIREETAGPRSWPTVIQRRKVATT